MASAFTDSLSRSGLGGMLVPFTLVDGTVSTPAFAFQNEPNTGIYRAGAFDARFAVGGADVFKWATASLVGLAPLTFSGLAASATAIDATGGSGDSTGIKGHATGTGAGVQGFSSSTSGSVALVGTGASAQLGLLVSSSSASVDVARIDGYVNLSQATNPAATTGFTNRLTPKNIPKAFISMSTNGSGGFTVADAFNITTGSIAVSILGTTIPFASAMANTNYTVVGNAHSGQPLAFFVQTKNTNSVVIYVMTFAAPGTPLGSSNHSYGFEFAVYGEQ